MIIVLFLTSGLAKAQEEKGIQFEHGLTWAQLKEKAKKENKYIFLDGFTTWCAPCKIMANNIFPQPAVADFFNHNFINIKVQFDVAKNDNEEVKSWYKEAKIIQYTYKVNGYPTYLFFNPQGELMHTIIGSSPNAQDFIAKAKYALNPATQYNNLKRQYEKGKKGPDFLLALINAAQQANDSEFTPVVMNAYLTTQKDLLTAENLKFISIATSKTTDPGYSILRNHGEKVDSVAGKGKSAEIIKTVVFDEIVLPYLRVGGVKMNYGGGMVDYTGELNKNVDWAVIKAKLNTQYPNLSDEIIMSAKPMYFRWQDNWPAFSEAVSAYASKYGNGLNNNVINSYAWDIFLFSNDVKCMEAALAWSKGTLSGENDKNIMYLYTYGNLLYKSGKKEQAIATIEDAIKYSGEVNGQLTTLVGKMKNGEKTW